MRLKVNWTEKRVRPGVTYDHGWEGVPAADIQTTYHSGWVLQFVHDGTQAIGVILPDVPGPLLTKPATELTFRVWV